MVTQIPGRNHIVSAKVGTLCHGGTGFRSESLAGVGGGSENQKFPRVPARRRGKMATCRRSDGNLFLHTGNRPNLTATSCNRLSSHAAPIRRRPPFHWCWIILRAVAPAAGADRKRAPNLRRHHRRHQVRALPRQRFAAAGQLRQAIASAREANERLRCEGRVVDGRPSPWLAVLAQAQKAVLAFAHRLRLSPQGRSPTVSSRPGKAPAPLSYYERMQLERSDAADDG